MGDDFFGHVRGAFTGAVDRRAGLLAAAGGGTLLLDDLDNLELEGQRQLLEVLDRGRFHSRGGRIGSSWWRAGSSSR